MSDAYCTPGREPPSVAANNNRMIPCRISKLTSISVRVPEWIHSEFRGVSRDRILIITFSDLDVLYSLLEKNLFYLHLVVVVVEQDSWTNLHIAVPTVKYLLSPISQTWAPSDFLIARLLRVTLLCQM